ncbi:MAG: hypothetical protein P8J33_09895 [Pirellulaceae bacterium]|nr:hypothetical protein [Pirellulaceae bacterium]
MHNLAPYVSFSAINQCFPGTQCITSLTRAFPLASSAVSIAQAKGIAFVLQNSSFHKTIRFPPTFSSAIEDWLDLKPTLAGQIYHSNDDLKNATSSQDAIRAAKP